MSLGLLYGWSGKPDPDGRIRDPGWHPARKARSYEEALAACEVHAEEPLSWDVIHEDDKGNPVTLEASWNEGRYFIMPAYK